MGMFDYIRCKYPLPVDGTQDLEYQTKDTASQFLDLYEIREDGSLWHEYVERVWRDDNNSPLGGVMHRVFEEWRPVVLTGEISFGASYGEENFSGVGDYYVHYSAYFENGYLQRLKLINNENGSSKAGGWPNE